MNRCTITHNYNVRNKIPTRRGRARVCVCLGAEPIIQHRGSTKRLTSTAMIFRVFLVGNLVASVSMRHFFNRFKWFFNPCSWSVCKTYLREKLYLKPKMASIPFHFSALCSLSLLSSTLSLSLSLFLNFSHRFLDNQGIVTNFFFCPNRQNVHCDDRATVAQLD